MLNFRVRDLDKLAAQLRAAGIAVEVDPQSYPNGRFASLRDPEGNPIQLWQPAKPPRGSLLNGPGLFLDFSWVTGELEVISGDFRSMSTSFLHRWHLVPTVRAHGVASICR
jgi:hypothetical protein